MSALARPQRLPQQGLNERARVDRLLAYGRDRRSQSTPPGRSVSTDAWLLVLGAVAAVAGVAAAVGGIGAWIVAHRGNQTADRSLDLAARQEARETTRSRVFWEVRAGDDHAGVTVVNAGPDAARDVVLTATWENQEHVERRDSMAKGDSVTLLPPGRPSVSAWIASTLAEHQEALAEAGRVARRQQEARDREAIDGATSAHDRMMAQLAPHVRGVTAGALGGITGGSIGDWHDAQNVRDEAQKMLEQRRSEVHIDIDWHSEHGRPDWQHVATGGTPGHIHDDPDTLFRLGKALKARRTK